MKSNESNINLEYPIPKHWQEKCLADVCHVITDGTHKTPKFKKSGIRFISIKNIRSYSPINWDSYEKYISEVEHAELIKRCFPEKNDILFPRIGTLGFAKRIDFDEPVSLFVGLGLLKPNKTIVNPFFLEHWMNSPFVSTLSRNMATGSGRLTLALKSTRKFPIPLPPIPEQELIVENLDEAVEAIKIAKSNIEKNIANARELFESELNRIFSKKGDGWVDKTLEEMSQNFGRGKSKHRPRNASFLYNGDYPFVQTGDIRNSEHFISNYTQTYSEAGLSQSKLWPAGTICITIAANIAETGILGFDACFPDSIIGIIPDPEKSDSGYVEYLLQLFKNELQKQGKGSAQDNINLGTFKELKFPFAPLSEQQNISAKLDAQSEDTKRLNKIYQQKLNAITELKQSILHKAFTGELTADKKALDRSLVEGGL